MRLLKIAMKKISGKQKKIHISRRRKITFPITRKLGFLNVKLLLCSLPYTLINYISSPL